MRHYFINSEKTQQDYFTFEEQFMDYNYSFTSCSDVFSKHKLDEGTKVLLKNLIKNNELSGKVLDLGCGYGAIGIVLKRHYASLKLTMVDINNTAVDLARKNVASNLRNADNVEISSSDAGNDIDDTFDYVISNPPIKTGKKVLNNFCDSAYRLLKDGGSYIAVIRRDKGADSYKKYCQQVFNNCKVIARDKGYYVLKSVK